MRTGLFVCLAWLVLLGCSTNHWIPDSKLVAAELYGRLSLAYLAQGNTTMAFERLQQGLALHQDNGQIQLALAMYKAYEQQWQAAEQAFRRAFELQPTSQVAFNFGHYLSQRQTCEKALPYLDQARQDTGYSNRKAAQVMADQCRTQLAHQ
jgi:Tfp pilus assembly protein PilF